MEVIEYNLNLINKKAQYSKLNFIDSCEKEYHTQINNVVLEILKNPNARFLLISGPSSAGKTTTSKLFKQGLENNGICVYTISLDDFFISREQTPTLPNGEKDFESANSIDWKLFDECMSALLNGEPTKLPTFNFKIGEKEFINPPTLLCEKDFVIIEGLHALNPIVDNFIPTEKCFRLYINTNCNISHKNINLSQEDVRLTRRLIRDVEDRGYAPEYTLSKWKSVCDGEKLYINPFKSRANFSIKTFHPYELNVYAYILDKLKIEHIQNTHLEKLLNFYKQAVQIDPDFVPPTSLLQEFIKIKY